MDTRCETAVFTISIRIRSHFVFCNDGGPLGTSFPRPGSLSDRDASWDSCDIMTFREPILLIYTSACFKQRGVVLRK